MARSERLGRGPVGPLLLQFSLPAIAGMLVNALYNVVDRIFVGQGVGSLAIAGITVSFPVMVISLALSALISLGATASISLRLGEGRREAAEQVAGNALALLMLVGITYSVVGLSYLEKILSAFGASSAVMPFAVEYQRVMLAGNVLMAVGFGLSHMIRAEGNPTVPMYMALVGTATNIVLDWVAVFPLQMGVRGAALATVISQGVGVAMALRYYLRGRSLVRLRLPNLRLRLAVCLGMVGLGIPHFIMQVLNSAQQVILNRSLAYYGGDLAIAAMGIVFSLGTFFFMPVIGVAQGAQPIIGYNYGARQFDRVREAFKLAGLGATAIVLIGFVATRIWPEQLIGLFSRDDPELVRLGAHILWYFFLLVPTVGFQVISSGYFQAVGKPVHATVLTLSRQVLLFIPLLLILPRLWGLEGIWRVAPLADAGSTLMTAAFILREWRRLEGRMVPALELANPPGRE
ncbi:MAG: MATE family efflux transporter [Moorellales bacterium]